MAKTYTYLAVSSEVSETTGKYFDDPETVVESNSYSKELENINQLMEKTYRFIQTPVIES